MKQTYIVKVDKDIELRIRDKNEAEELFILINKNRKFLEKYLDWVSKTKKVKDSENFILKKEDEFKNKKSCDFGIYFKGKMVGSGGFHKFDLTRRNGEIGYWLAEDFTGKGIMTKSLKKMIEIGKKKYKLHRIELLIDEKNESSIAVAKRMNFVYEGTLRHLKFYKRKWQNIQVWSLLV